MGVVGAWPLGLAARRAGRAQPSLSAGAGLERAGHVVADVVVEVAVGLHGGDDEDSGELVQV